MHPTCMQRPLVLGKDLDGMVALLHLPLQALQHQLAQLEHLWVGGWGVAAGTGPHLAIPSSAMDLTALLCNDQLRAASAYRLHTAPWSINWCGAAAP